MELERKKQTQLANEILSLQSQLQDAKNGLSAASRLTNKLEMGQSTIEKLQNSSKCNSLIITHWFKFSRLHQHLPSQKLKHISYRVLQKITKNYTCT